jgi:hypothetical protein
MADFISVLILYSPSMTIRGEIFVSSISYFYITSSNPSNIARNMAYFKSAMKPGFLSGFF